MQIISLGGNLHEMFKPIFLGKKIRNIYAAFTPRVVKNKLLLQEFLQVR